jgi:hypothetical protein
VFVPLYAFFAPSIQIETTLENNFKFAHMFRVSIFVSQPEHTPVLRLASFVPATLLLRSSPYPFIGGIVSPRPSSIIVHTSWLVKYRLLHSWPFRECFLMGFYSVKGVPGNLIAVRHNPSTRRALTFLQRGIQQLCCHGKVNVIAL